MVPLERRRSVSSYAQGVYKLPSEPDREFLNRLDGNGDHNGEQCDGDYDVSSRKLDIIATRSPYLQGCRDRNIYNVSQVSD